MHPFGRVLLIFLGGACGAALRALLLAAPHANSAASEALALAGINVAGALLLGLLLGAATAASRRADALRALLGTGLMGGFTSYSSLVLFVLPPGGDWVAGAILGVLSLVAGVAAAALGLGVGGRIARSRANADRPPGDAPAADGKGRAR